jgi:hypothetical protein
MAMRRSGKAEYSAQLHAPVGLSHGNWILWKPSVDPILLYRDALRSFKTKRRVKMATVFAPAPLLVVALILTDLWVIPIPVQAWVGIALGLALLAPHIFRKWDQVEQRSRVGRFDKFAWIDDLAGSQCITQQTSHMPPAADRIVTSLATVADSRASAEGWVGHEHVLQLHEIAWESLAENHALNLSTQGQLLDEMATILERTATEANRMDAELRDLEKNAELDTLKQKFQTRQSRALQISADLEARLGFLREQHRTS